MTSHLNANNSVSIAWVVGGSKGTRKLNKFAPSCTLYLCIYGRDIRASLRKTGSVLCVGNQVLCFSTQVGTIGRPGRFGDVL